MKNPALLIEVAAGRKAADLVLKNADIVNVFTGEIIRGDIAVCGGYIAGVGSYTAKNEADCTGKTVCPGFIDAHIHIESTMVLPPEFVRMALPSGTTTVIADPHEIVNVCGADGMQFMLDISEELPCNMFFVLPSSVPATIFETNGASFAAKEMKQFLNHPRVIGLGEVMCFPDVVAGQGQIMDILPLFENAMVDGHAPGLLGHSLQAYAAAGVCTEHEATTFAEAAEKARAGLAVLVREGSAAHNLAAIVNGLLESGIKQDRFMFCTDDKHLDDLARDGHIRWNVKMAIDLGMNPIDAIRMGTWNAAAAYGLKDIGAVAPGYKADLVVLNSLAGMEVTEVYKDGVSAEKHIAKIPRFAAAEKYSPVLNSMKAKQVTVQDLALPANGSAHVIEMVPYQLVTNHLQEDIPTQNGFFAPNSTYCKLCVVERHGKNGNIAAAPLKGYGITRGAIATSVAHDSHNIIAAGDNDADIALAINRLREIGGGYVLVEKGGLAGEVPLKVAGLMSAGDAETVQKITGEIIAKAHTMGIPYYVDPFISLSFMALPVIPSLRLTDLGLFDVDEFKLVEQP